MADEKPSEESYIKFDDTRNITWPADFKVVENVSGMDQSVQKSYFYKTKSAEPKPLIVSLHTWSGDYTQKDDVAAICKEKDVNYIHPDFRGANVITSACCSELALADIDDAISYAIKNAKVDTAKIYVIGVSGGGYATLATFMKSKHRIRKFSVWASISDLTAWYHESTILGNKYAKNILNCTGSQSELNVKNARYKSPLYMPGPGKNREGATLYIFAGIYDGIQGSVPITHSINFYNKLLTDLSVADKSQYVSDAEKLNLLEFRRPLGALGTIGGRKICLQKEYENFKLTIFEGNHEMLSTFAVEQLLDQ
ncbi:S9 family peptidase [Dyadobacter sp. NIV53]|uniref:alpha/beta hydrolase family protein n=1 Tax=Dyadobacter sp. NIV53 TaxID=2861765 RepID=UPI001C86D4E5|nr:prolyl oligopeptidase family serine peptidase [Dyadobacter sp. NIV53]